MHVVTGFHNQLLPIVSGSGHFFKLDIIMELFIHNLCKYTYNILYKHITYVHTNTCVHTCLHAYAHTYVHAYIHVYIHVYIHMNMT